jgi:mono/diheme cytochrome c family protein
MTGDGSLPRIARRRRQLLPGRLLWAFGLLGIAFVATVAWAIIHERQAEWRTWQARFEALTHTRLEEPGIRQIWLPQLGRVDRCTTCHLGISDASLASAPQPFRAHSGSWLVEHRVERFGCTVCHGGQGAATTYRDAGHHRIPHWDDPIRSPELMESRCGQCHVGRIPPRAPWLAEGRARIAASNCMGCHELPGFSPDEVRAPRLDGLGYKMNPVWLKAWLHAPSDMLPGSRMPDFRLTDEETRALTAFLRTLSADPPVDGHWDWDQADPEAGAAVFRRSRCVTCHAIDGRGGTVGPELTREGEKASREWIASYLADPHRYQPKTLMPQFRFTHDEVRDIAAHLSEDLWEEEQAPAAIRPAPPEGPEVKKGRQVFIKRGCDGCHALDTMKDVARIGPSLAGVGDRHLDLRALAPLHRVEAREVYAFTKVSDPVSVLATARMPTFGFTPMQAGEITVAVMALRARPMPTEYLAATASRPAYVPQGEFGALVQRYRCLSCHSVNGTGGTLSTVAFDRIGSQLQRDYIERFLLDPVAVRVGLAERMPKLGIDKEEATTLAGYLSAVFVDDALESPVPVEPDAAARGTRLYADLGCRGCHMTTDRGGGYLGPGLAGSGARLKPGWVVAFLRDPERWKPGTLQPDYGLTQQQARDLTAYVMSLPALRKGRTP